MMENRSIQGSVAVSRHVTSGGNASVEGNVAVGHHLMVKGWVDAPNIKGAFKGLYSSAESLRGAYPRPMPGWFALVGNTVPADVYRADPAGPGKLEWKPTGERGGEFKVWLDDIHADLERHDEELSNHDELIGDLQACASEHGERLTAAEAEIKGHGEELRNHSTQISTLQQTAKEHEQKLDEHAEELGNHDELIGDLQACASEHGERLTAAEVEIKGHGEELKGQEEELKYQRQMIYNTNEGLGAVMTDLYGLFTRKREEELERMAAAGEMEAGKFYFSVEDDDEEDEG